MFSIVKSNNFSVVAGAFIGYIFWYKALSSLSSTTASVLQLSVPVIAAIGSVIFLSEKITETLVVATLLIWSGILIFIKYQD